MNGVKDEFNYLKFTLSTGSRIGIDHSVIDHSGSGSTVANTIFAIAFAMPEANAITVAVKENKITIPSNSMQ